MGFWNDPELKDALEWRENFKPNETWAQLYKETGERQYKASFAESMQYLDESEINRDEEIAEDTRQQNALRKYARNLRWMVAALFILLIAALGVAAYAFSLRAEAVRVNSKLEIANRELENEKTATISALKSLGESNGKLNLEKQEKDEAFKKLEVKTQELESNQKELSKSLELQKGARQKAEAEKIRADEQTEQAKRSEAAKEVALEEQKYLREVAESKQLEAENERARAENFFNETTKLYVQNEANLKREEMNRSGLIFLEQEEFKRALPEFQKLLARFEDESEPMSKESRSDGKWWAFHNLGIVKSKLPNTFSDRFRETECSYNKALNVLQDKLVELKLPSKKLDVSKCPPEESENSGQNVAPNIKREEEINRSQVTTLRRLAQFYREEAQNTPDEQEAERLNTLAVENYNKILAILPQEFNFQKEETYPAALYVELADTLSDLNSRENNKKVTELYEKAAQTYKTEGEFATQIEVLKKWSDFEIEIYQAPKAIKLLKELVEIQEHKEKLNLSPFDLEIAESYNTIDKAYRASGTTNEAYGELSRLIVDFDREAHKGQAVEKRIETVENLANAYIRVGKCPRAEEVYLEANGESSKKTSIYSSFLIKIGQFYRNVLNDNKNAETYFANFVEEVKKLESRRLSETPGGIRNPVIYRPGDAAARVTAGDFYFEIKNYDMAEEIYQQAKLVNVLVKKRLIESEKIINNIEEAEITAKIARVYEAQNKLEIAETKYSEAVNLVTKLEPMDNSNNLIARKAKVLIDQADFYEKRGNRQKTQDIYIKTEAILRAKPAATPTEQMALEVYVNKKLGDINRDKIKIADHYYSRAIHFIVRFRSPSRSEDSQYYRKNKLTAKFHSDLAEIYESKISLNSTENTNVLQTKAQEARKEAEKLKLEEQKSVCKENN
jgi:tetratricopeptide (TPR) repeat protein